MGIEQQGADGIRSFADYKNRYFPHETEADKQAELMALPPEEFGRHLAGEWAAAFRAVLAEFLKPKKRKKPAHK